MKGRFGETRLVLDMSGEIMKTRFFTLAWSTVALAGVSSIALAQTVTIASADFGGQPGNLTNTGLPGSFVNTVVTATAGSNYALTDTVNINSGDFTSVNAGTFSIEPSIRMENSGFPGLYAYFGFITTGTSYVTATADIGPRLMKTTSTAPYTFAGVTVAPTLLTGAAITASSTWTFECYETYRDGVATETLPDSTGANISFTLPGSIIPPPPPPTGAIDLGTISASNSTLTTNVPALAASEIKWYKFVLPATVNASTPDFFEAWTTDDGSGGVDTEIGIYNTAGNLVASNDDFTGLWSDLSWGSGAFPGGGTGGSGTSLASGTYYLAAGRFNVTFGAANYTVTSTGPATTSFNLNLATSVSAPANQNLTGTLNLGDTGGAFAFNRSIGYSVKQGTSTIGSGTVVASASASSFSISLPASATGAATIEWDGSSFLLRKTNVNLTGSNAAIGSVTMQNGDVDNTGEVDAADIDQVIADFGLMTDVASDVDVSGEVDAADIDIVIANFGGMND